jgi:hypothetical protein
MYVYFIQAGRTNGLVKIGYAKDPEKRMADLQIGSSLPLRLIYKIKVSGLAEARDKERYFHLKFARQRAHGEWFYCARHLKRMGILQPSQPDTSPERLPESALEHLNSI